MKMKVICEVMQKMQPQWARDLHLYGDAPKKLFHAAPEICLQMVPEKSLKS